MFSDRSPFKILVIDDDEEDFFITGEYIKNIHGYNFIVEWADDYKKGLREMVDKKYDLYLIDYFLGARTGLDLIKEAIENNCEEPMIILTGKGTPEIDSEAMHAGAVDYIVKGEMNTEKLERSIRHVIERSKGIRTLRSNERKFRSIFEHSKDAIFLADPDYTFREVNNAATEVFGFTRDELMEMKIADLLAEKKDEAMIMALLEKGEIEDLEIAMKTKEGETIWTVLSLSKEKDNIERAFLQGIIHDITNLKKAEKTTLRIEKMGMAERLVRTLAHEVRNPLNNINLSLEQLNAEMVSEDAKMYLEIITRNSRRIEMLIKELLGASRPEIEFRDSDLKLILDDAIAAANDRMILRHIKLEKKYPDGNMALTADHEKLKIAFLNIIINAVEAMEDYGTLSIMLDDEDGAYKLMIRDTGCGISEENLKRLFEPWFTAKKNGLGLGLATTMSILQSHNAVAEVQSQPGSGTTFIITLQKVKDHSSNN